MELNQWLLYTMAVLVLTLSPGPCALLCVTNSIQHGLRSALASSLGSITANLMLIVFVAIGLAHVLAASEHGFRIIKWGGAAYLIYLGIQAIRSKAVEPSRTDESSASAPQQSSLRLFMNGFILGATNPKDLLFFSAFLPQFVNASQPVAIQYTTMGLTFFVLEAICLLAYGVGAVKARRWLAHPGRMTAFNRTTGGLYISAGAALAAAQKN